MSRPSEQQNHSVLAPDLQHLGNSRIGRKLRRKALDRYHKAKRRADGTPAKSGPPIPNSEKQGRRDFYTLEQVRHGGRRSGVSRRAKALPKWLEVERLRNLGYGVREIARRVGMSAGWISKLLRRISERVFPEHIHHQPSPTDGITQTPRMLMVLALHEAAAKNRMAENPKTGGWQYFLARARAKGYSLKSGYSKPEITLEPGQTDVSNEIRLINKLYGYNGFDTSKILSGTFYGRNP